jgi:spore germination protein YaaH
MVEEAARLATDYGFDGVQWDYEICPDGDRGFLALMRETRAALPAGKLLSAATPLWLPSPLRTFGWSEDTYADVAATCDQVVPMCYDSGFWLPRSYVWLVRRQSVHVTHAVGRGNPRCRVLFGLPTYGRGGLSHNPRAESLLLAIKGVREGLAAPGANHSVFAGVALFADYTTSEAQWQTYDRWWLRP